MKRNGGTLLVDSLIGLGATKSFGVPGESYLAVLDALHDTRGRLDYVLCRNEGGAAFMGSGCCSQEYACIKILAGSDFRMQICIERIRTRFAHAQLGRSNHPF